MEKLASPETAWKMKGQLQKDAFGAHQMSLFQTFLANSPDEADRLSNTVALWDGLPKYSVTQREQTKHRDLNGHLPPRTTRFAYNGCEYDLVITPAMIETETGIYTAFYPSANEELVEDCLRKLSTKQKKGFYDQTQAESGVKFTLYELREELRRNGHSRSYQQVCTSLEILSSANIKIREIGSKEFLSAAILPKLFASSATSIHTDKEGKWLAYFHPLLSNAIRNIEYRQYNFDTNMQLKSQLARWMHKRLCARYRQASRMKLYTIRYSTIRDESELLQGYAEQRQAVAKTKAMLNSLVKGNVISHFDVSDEKEKCKVVDILFTLHPSSDFIASVKQANKQESLLADR